MGITLDERYRLDAVLGEGGMGAVFRATHLAMDRKVAVKLLKPHLTSDATQQQRFAREARSTMKVESPHAVKVLDFGVTPALAGAPEFYMVLEYLDGRTVQQELEIDGAFTPARAVHIARQALHALGAAHRRGLVHRDIKPDNLLLMRVGADLDYTKVLDFGVAKVMDGQLASGLSALALTQQGMVFGTPEFMSPEQAVGSPLDGRSDLYALAATVVTMLTGAGMFEGITAFDWLVHHVRTPAPHLAALVPDLAAYPELDRLLQHCLAKSRDERPATAEALDAMFAALEPTLARAPGAAPVGARAAVHRAVSASSYVARLSPPSGDERPGPGAATVDPRDAGGEPRLSDPHAATLDPQAPREAGDAPDSSSALPAAHHRRRRRVIAAAALVAVAVVAVALIAGRSSSSGARTAAAAREAGGVVAASPLAAAPRAADDEAAHHDAGTAEPPGDAALARGAPIVVASTRRSPVPPPDRSHPVARPVTAVTHPSAPNPHLQAAEAAAAAGNRLRQLAEADLALRADPRSPRARYLLGDALVATGDLDRGCAYLRKLARNARAAARARTAGCPAD